MPSTLEYPITDTVNDMVACDQIRLEIEMEATILSTLLDDPNGVQCTKDRVFFNFDSDLSGAGVTALDGIVESHTGEGLKSPNELDEIAVADLPDGLSRGASFFITDGNQGPAPAWYDGTDWRWYDSKAIVAP